MQNSGPKQATQSPIVTGTSVIAIKYKDGVVMAADNLGTSPPRNNPTLATVTVTTPYHRRS